MIIDSLFPSPLGKSQVVLSKQITDATRKLKMVRNTSANLWFSENKNIFDLDGFVDLKYQVDNIVKHFCVHGLGLSEDLDFQCNGSWYNKFYPGDWAGAHFHANSFISGVLYLNTPIDSGGIVFHNDTHRSNLFGPFFNPPFGKYTKFNGSTMTFEPEQGDVYLFPSSIPHSVERNDSQEVRESIAFDYMICGRIYSTTNTLFVSK